MRNAARNILWVFGGDIFRRLVGFLTVIIIARRGGIEGFGMYSIAFTVLTYGLMLSSGGLHLYGVRESAAERTESLAGKIAGARLMISGLLFVVIVACSFFVTNLLQREIIVLVGISLFPNATFLDWYFQGRERMGIVVGARAVSAAVYCTAIYFLVNGTDSLLWVGAGMIAGDILASLIYIIGFVREGKPFAIELNPASWWPLVRTSFPLGLGTVLGALSVNFPPLAIGIFLGAAEAGIYSAATKLIIALLVLDRVIGQVFIPATVRIFAKENERFSAELVRAIKWVVLIAVPVAVGGTLVSEKIIDLVFGVAFKAAIPVFRIAAWYFPVTLLHTIYTAGLIAVQAEREYGRVMTLSAVLYVVLTLAGMFAYGIIGAAIGVVLAETITMIAMRAVFCRTIPLPFPKGLFRISASAMAMGVVVWYAQGLGLLPVIGIAIAVYMALLLVTRTVSYPEIADLVRKP